MSEKSLIDCNDKSPFDPSLNIDPVPPFCGTPDLPSQKEVAFDNLTTKQKQIGIGQSANCDPMQFGHIVDDMRKSPSRETITRYSQALRGCDEAIKDLFNDLVVIDEDGIAHKVPIIINTPEKAVAFILQENVRKDNTLVVDRIRLPILAVYQSGIDLNQNRYLYHKAIDYFRREDSTPGFTNREKRERDTVFGKARGIPVDISYQLNAWTLYLEDMNQIMEQIFLKFSPVAYIRIQGVNYETIVKFTGTANNKEPEPGDKGIRVIKYQFNMTVETYIPQPIVRKKAVLEERIDIVNMCDKDITEVLRKLEIAVGK